MKLRNLGIFLFSIDRSVILVLSKEIHKTHSESTTMTTKRILPNNVKAVFTATTLALELIVIENPNRESIADTMLLIDRGGIRVNGEVIDRGTIIEIGAYRVDVQIGENKFALKANMDGTVTAMSLS